MAPRYKPTSTYPTQFPGGEAVSFDPVAFDEAIKSQGVMLEHHQGMRCPVGMVDRHDTVRRPHEHHAGCQNGFLYRCEGVFQGLFTGNNANLEFRDQGLADSSQSQVTAPRFYSSDTEVEPKRVYLSPMDKLYYRNEKILVPHWELIESSPDGNDRLQFPAVQVSRVVDNRNVSYGPGDYEVRAGNIVWLGQSAPGIDVETGKGRVYVVHYLYRPWWYIKTMSHEIRVTNIDNDQTGERQAEKMPQSCSVVREYFYLSKESDDAIADDQRLVRGPEDGSFPPR